jgi:nitrogen fixation NifU-like protein
MFKDNKLNLKNNWKEFSEIFDKKHMARKECLLLPLRTVLKALQ